VELDVLYQDRALLAVAKPAGLLTQAPLGIDSLQRRVEAWLAAQQQPRGKVYLGIVHRLDRPVSGVILFARHVRAARRLSEQFAGRLVRKRYLALVEGQVEPEAGEWTDFLAKVEGEARSLVVPPSHPDGRLAILRYQVRQRLPDRTLLEIELETGRTHQIRVQCACRGHPLVGDTLYGARASFGPPCDDARSQPIALHAAWLQCRHPITRDYLTVVAPLPPLWHQAAGLAPGLGCAALPDPVAGAPSPPPPS
jgi:RluA family pseudouridine synthase